MKNEMFGEASIDIELAVALDTGLLSWTMPAVINIVRNLAR
jgi:hypothetical protein